MRFAMQRLLHDERVFDAAQRAQATRDAPARDAGLAIGSIALPRLESAFEMLQCFGEIALRMECPAEVVVQGAEPLLCARLRRIGCEFDRLEIPLQREVLTVERA